MTHPTVRLRCLAPAGPSGHHSGLPNISGVGPSPSSRFARPDSLPTQHSSTSKTFQCQFPCHQDVAGHQATIDRDGSSRYGARQVRGEEGDNARALVRPDDVPERHQRSSVLRTCGSLALRSSQIGVRTVPGSTMLARMP